MRDNAASSSGLKEAEKEDELVEAAACGVVGFGGAGAAAAAGVAGLAAAIGAAGFGLAG
jgi:hypothetical protein